MSDQVIPAFDGNGDTLTPRGGLTLRDWFAGQVIAALLQSRVDDQDGRATLLYWGENGIGWNHSCVPSDLSRIAFEMADALLEKRSKPVESKLLDLLKRALPIVQQHKSPGPAMSDPWTPPYKFIAEIKSAIAEAKGSVPP